MSFWATVGGGVAATYIEDLIGGVLFATEHEQGAEVVGLHDGEVGGVICTVSSANLRNETR